MYKPLCLFSNKYIQNLAVSKDIVQDVFIKIWEDKIEFNNENVIKSYLYISVKNKSLDYLKSKLYKSTDFLSTKNIENIETHVFFLREVVITETSFIMKNAINTLPNKCAKIIKMSLKGLTNSEIANELELSINTIKTQKKIAYNRLRPLLKKFFIFIAFVFSGY
jgi:RNA polymerase sigma-70 factor (ECF subfamily)